MHEVRYVCCIKARYTSTANSELVMGRGFLKMTFDHCLLRKFEHWEKVILCDFFDT